MAVREIRKMGDARLLRVARPVEAFDTRELHVLVAEMFDTMQAAGADRLAAPQLGVDLGVTSDRAIDRNPASRSDAGKRINVSVPV